MSREQQACLFVILAMAKIFETNPKLHAFLKVMVIFVLE
jgi:hypothetical protein